MRSIRPGEGAGCICLAGSMWDLSSSGGHGCAVPPPSPCQGEGTLFSPEGRGWVRGGLNWNKIDYPVVPGIPYPHPVLSTEQLKATFSLPGRRKHSSPLR